MHLGLFVVLFILFLTGAPIAVVLGLSAIWEMHRMGGQLTFFFHQFFHGVNSVVLLAIPLFLLAGELMNQGGITTRIINFSQTLVGHFRGGLSYVTVLANMFFAGISGSAVADLGAIGSVLIPGMKKEGYDADYAAAVNSSASLCGPLIPPSIPMVIYGALAQVSIGGLFLGGAVPGVTLGLILMVISYVVAVKRKYPASRKMATFSEIIKAGKEAILAILMPLLILGGILGGICTPTEAAAVAVIYGFFVGVFIYREINLRKVIDALERVVLRTSIIMLILASASVFGWLLDIAQIPQSLGVLLNNFTNSTFLILLMVNILLLIVGCFLTTHAALIILVPLLLPIVQSYGVSPLHFGVVMVFNFMIGLLTPPVATCLYLGASLAEISVTKAFHALIPFITAMLVILAVITYWPGFVLFLPRLFYGSSVLGK